MKDRRINSITMNERRRSSFRTLSFSAAATVVVVVVAVASSLTTCEAFSSTLLALSRLPVPSQRACHNDGVGYRRRRQRQHRHCETPASTTMIYGKRAGTFFNQVPDEDDDGGDINENHVPNGNENSNDGLDDFQEQLRRRMNPSIASQPSTIGGIPTKRASRMQAEAMGFGVSKPKKQQQSKIDKDVRKDKKKQDYISIGPRLNDVTKPEYDDQGYTLYADERTGEKSRVFEALVDYPCDFTMKIVGANEGMFVQEMLQVVASTCEVDDATKLSHSVRALGKWTSVTVQAPVKSAEMLYELYERVDKDPRVKFKF